MAKWWFHGDFPVRKLLVYQRVSWISWSVSCLDSMGSTGAMDVGMRAILVKTGPQWWRRMVTNGECMGFVWTWGYDFTTTGYFFRFTLWWTYKKLLKMAIYSGFSHEKWWFSIAMLIYQRVYHLSSIICHLVDSYIIYSIPLIYTLWLFNIAMGNGP